MLLKVIQHLVGWFDGTTRVGFSEYNPQTNSGADLGVNPCEDGPKGLLSSNSGALWSLTTLGKSPPNQEIRRSFGRR